MARRGVPKRINWFLREWMDARGLQGRGAQARMMDLTGWPKATMSQLYNNTQDYSPELLNQAAKALNAEPWELLMPPERAMAIRKFQAGAEEIVRLAHVTDAPINLEDEFDAREERREKPAVRGTGTHG